MILINDINFMAAVYVCVIRSLYWVIIAFVYNDCQHTQFVFVYSDYSPRVVQVKQSRFFWPHVGLCPTFLVYYYAAHFTGCQYLFDLRFAPVVNWFYQPVVNHTKLEQFAAILTCSKHCPKTLHSESRTWHKSYTASVRQTLTDWHTVWQTCQLWGTGARAPSTSS